MALFDVSQPSIAYQSFKTQGMYSFIQYAIALTASSRSPQDLTPLNLSWNSNETWRDRMSGSVGPQVSHSPVVADRRDGQGPLMVFEPGVGCALVRLA